MKLFRYGPRGSEKPGAADKYGIKRDLSGVVTDFAGVNISPEKLAAPSKVDLTAFPQVSDDERLGPCITGTGKFICIGLNYADHVAESGLEVPPEPVIFMKATSAICGPMTLL